MIGRLLGLALLREARSRDAATTLLLVGGLVVVVSDLALHDLPERPEVVSATVWLAVVFGASVGLARGIAADADRGVLDTLLALPASRPALYAALAGSNAVLVAALAAVVVPAQFALAGDAVAATDLLAVPVVGLGVVGVAAAATLLSAVAARTRAREAMLPVLLLPVLAPVLVAGMHATAEVLHGAGWDDVRPEVTLLAGYDVAVLALSALLFEHAVEG